LATGGFTVTELFKGTFTTLAGNTPGFTCKALAAGIKGTFYGDYVWNVEPHVFNPGAVPISDPGACKGSEHFDEVHFGITAPGECSGLKELKWQFRYKDGTGGTGHEWTNAEEPVIKSLEPSGSGESYGNIES